MDRARDQMYCTELAGQALDVWFDRTWEQIEPTLESTWEHGDHAMPWCEARWFVKCAWTDALSRGAEQSSVDEFSAARVPRGAAPCDRPATH
jgi:hypothetical protein